MEVVGPCDKGTKAEFVTSVLEDVTVLIGPIVDGFVKGAVGKDVFFLLRPDATAGAWRRRYHNSAQTHVAFGGHVRARCCRA